MKCQDYMPYVPVFDSPYPEDSGQQISDIDYVSPLHLCRCKDAVQLGDGGDADYVVSQPYTLRFKLNGALREITVPEGMLTDLSSVPWFARWFIGRVGSHLEASIVHDFLYIAWQDLQGYNPSDQDREFADRLLCVAMKELGFSRLKRWIVYLVLWGFGRGAFMQPNDMRYVKDQ